MLYGAIEAGGTKMVLAAGDENGRILRRDTLPTLTPAETVPKMIAFFRETGIAALGVGCFGPLDLDAASPTYGYITATPKLAWRNYPILPVLQEALRVPCALDTDVNAAALCEARLGAARGVKNALYLTVGTGVGGGVYCEGRLVHGGMHPEWGHFLLRPREDDPMPQGVCPYHAGCVEGLASGPAMEKRWGVSAKELPADHPAWDLEAYYLAQVCTVALMTLSTERIILGGGVMSQTRLFPLIRRKTAEMVNGYLSGRHATVLEETIVPPACFPDSGLVGSLLLGVEALR